MSIPTVPDTCGTFVRTVTVLPGGVAPGAVGDSPDASPSVVAESRRMLAFLIRAALTGVALWVVTQIVPGVNIVGGDTTLERVGVIFVIALIFGLVNAFIKPVVQLLSIPLYIVTLGLFHVVVNALMLWITAWITDRTAKHWGLYIADFWWDAIWAAIVLSLVSWVLSLVVRDARRITG